MKPKPVGQADLIGREVVDELFNIKVLDPAMGSGHFLVEAVDFITDRILEFLNAFPWNPVQVHLRLMRETIGKEMESQNVEVDEKRLTDVNLLKRHVLKRCIYGVDLNPMAVELAKVSLWLDCFTLGAPLSFLDHHLRCGNSLIGVTVEEVREGLEGKGIGKDAGDRRSQMSLFESRFTGLLIATELMRKVGELSDITGAQVEQSRAEYRRAIDALAPFKRILDVYTAQWFVDSESSTGKREHPLVDFLKNREAEQLISARSSDEFRKAKRELAAADRRLMEQALRTAEDKKLFHWELEFPEAFYGPRRGTRNAVERLENAGFDAVIGNPPYIRVQELRRSDPDTADYVSARFNSAVKNFDLYLPFLERGLQLTTGQVSYIAPSKWFSTDYGAGLRKTAAEKKSLARVVDYGDYQIFEDVTNYTCICFLRSKPADTYIYVEAHRGELGPEQVRDGAALASDGSPWNFASGVEAALLARLAAKYPKLSEFRDRAFQGLRTSDNDVYVLTTDGRPRGGVLPVVSRATDDTHEIEKELLKPLLSGEQIRAFSLTHSGQYILFPYDLKGSKPELLSERRLRTDYPGAWRYLKACEKRLRAREQGKMDGPGWWAYGRNQNLDQFEQPKVMLPGYNDKPSAGLDLAGHFYHVSGYSLTLKEDAPIDLKVLAALLNSRLLYWFLAKTGVALQRGFVEFRPQYLDRLPIAVPKAGQRSSLDHLVDRAIRKGLAEIESELNALVGEMYEVSQEEMTILAGHRVVSSASRT